VDAVTRRSWKVVIYNFRKNTQFIWLNIHLWHYQQKNSIVSIYTLESWYCVYTFSSSGHTFYRNDWKIQNNPINKAITDEANDNFVVKSGLLTALPSRIDPSPTVAPRILITVVVPRQYEKKKLRQELIDVIASAGARLGAPSHEKPCSKPFANIAAPDFLVMFPPSSDDISAPAFDSKDSLIPIIPIKRRLKPTAESANPDNLFTKLKEVLILFFNRNAMNPSKVAETPCPSPHKAPILNPYHHLCPTLGGRIAARWSGPIL